VGVRPGLRQRPRQARQEWTAPRQDQDQGRGREHVHRRAGRSAGRADPAAPEVSRQVATALVADDLRFSNAPRARDLRRRGATRLRRCYATKKSPRFRGLLGGGAGSRKRHQPRQTPLNRCRRVPWGRSMPVRGNLMGVGEGRAWCMSSSRFSACVRGRPFAGATSRESAAGPLGIEVHELVEGTERARSAS
jgi:hypothetical protein